jgi:hypothetical protein
MNYKRPAKFVGFPVFVMFSALLLLSILCTTILLVPIRSAFADSYRDGYNEGCYDAGRDLRRLNGHGYDESVRHGDSQFRTGYVVGYRTCWSSEVGGGNYQPSPPPQLPSPPQLQPQPSPSYPNLNWIQICSSLNQVLISPCNQLVNRDNTLTYEGQPAYVCIQNGILLAGGGAVLLQLPLSLIIDTLRKLSTMTGCDGIIDWSPIDNNVGILLYIISIFSK